MSSKPPKLTDALPIVQPHVIDPRAIYTVKQFQQALALRSSTARREIRHGRLRVSKRGGKYFILGSWILSWIEGGEVKRHQPAPAASTLEKS